MNIFVGNLAFSATDHDLRQLFEPYGAVDKVNIITDRDTGRSRGFGFVEMPDSAAAKAAIQGLQGHQLAGRDLNVNEAKPREPRPAVSRFQDVPYVTPIYSDVCLAVYERRPSSGVAVAVFVPLAPLAFPVHLLSCLRQHSGWELGLPAPRHAAQYCRG